jgi:2-polyprenyl-3-methyl-5-hydroxy-6-metoxy-1,4-benzoquinol methylase
VGIKVQGVDMMVDYSCLKDCWHNYDNITVTTSQNSKDIISSFIKPGMRVLDYGCGKQGTLGCYGRFEAEEVIIDRYDTDKSINCIHNLKEINGTYDLIIFSHVIEHMPFDKALETLCWLISHGKIIILATPNSCSTGFDFWKDLTHVRPYSTPQTLSLIEALDGKLQRVYYSYRGELKTLPFRLITALGKDEKLKALYYEYVVIFKGDV